MTADLTLDHKPLEGALRTRRYFAKFERIIGHMQEVATIAVADGLLSDREAALVKVYLEALANTFSALSYKYLMTWRVSGELPNGMAVDRSESGFPVYQELLQMASDAQNLDQHLSGLPSVQAIKQDMVRYMLNEQEHPLRLQFAMSQRLYYEALAKGVLFWARSDPQAIWVHTDPKDKGERRHYLVHWAHFDSQRNVPVIYLMDLQDTGRVALLKDETRWPAVQAHLMAQSMSALKLVTIATGFDKDFDALHPIQLRRISLGPMYSHAYTQQSGPLRQILAEANSKPGEDWALAWTVETLRSKDFTMESTGWFSAAERQVYDLAAHGATEQRRSLILPERPYQVLEHRNPPGMRGVRKYVVGKKGRVLRYD